MPPSTGGFFSTVLHSGHSESHRAASHKNYRVEARVTQLPNCIPTYLTLTISDLTESYFSNACLKSIKLCKLYTSNYYRKLQRLTGMTRVRTINSTAIDKTLQKTTYIKGYRGIFQPSLTEGSELTSELPVLSITKSTSLLLLLPVT